jgi:hypothetical protein
LSWIILTNNAEVSTLLFICSYENNKVLCWIEKMASRCTMGRGQGFHANLAVCIHIGGDSGDERSGVDGFL